MKRLNVASKGKGESMKTYAIVVLCAIALLVIVLSSAGRGTTKPEIGSSLTPTPTPPAAVPGTELRGLVATVKPGYRFVSRGSSVDVMNIRKNIITGTYVCPCNSNDPARRCEIRFSPTLITCKSVSCSGGSCVLSAATPTLRR